MLILFISFPQSVDKSVDNFLENTIFLLFSLKKGRFCYTMGLDWVRVHIHNPANTIHKTGLPQ